MDDKLLDQMRTGKMATFIIYQTPEEGIGIPMSLTGFRPGLRRPALSGRVARSGQSGYRAALPGEVE